MSLGKSFFKEKINRQFSGWRFLCMPLDPSMKGIYRRVLLWLYIKTENLSREILLHIGNSFLCELFWLRYNYVTYGLTIKNTETLRQITKQLPPTLGRSMDFYDLGKLEKKEFKTYGTLPDEKILEHSSVGWFVKCAWPRVFANASRIRIKRTIQRMGPTTK